MLYSFSQALDTELTVNTLLKEWMVSLCKVLQGEIALLVDRFSHLLQIIMVQFNHFNSALSLTSREMAPHFLLSFISHSIPLRTKTIETSTMFSP